MTYKKSSVNKAVKSDFINCLKTNYLFPLLLLITTLSLNIISISTVIRNDRKSIHYILFGNELLFNSSTIIAIIALITGVITGIRSFAFLHKTPSTNVYLSLPITRYNLYTNRVISATIYNLIAAVIPMLIAMSLNYSLFEPTKLFPKLCLYFMAYIFIHSMLGFTIGSLTAIVVGKRNEARFFSLVLLFLPKLILIILTNLQSVFANGSGSMVSFTGYAKPEFEQFSTNIKEQLNFLDPLAIMFEAPSSTLIKNKKFIGFNYQEEILPLIIFAIICLIIIAITPILFNKRLAENADAVGVSKGLTIITSFLISILILSIITIFPPVPNEIALIIIGLLVSTLAYLIVYSILTRNKDKIIKCLKKLPLVTLLNVAIICATIGISKLYYAQIPNVEDIKSAYAVASGSDVVFKSISSNSGFDSKVAHDTIIGEITDKEDLKLLTDIHRTVTKSLYKGNGTFKVLYVMNDGSIKTRIYYKIGKEATKETYKIYQTKAYNDMLKYRFTADEETNAKNIDSSINNWLSYEYDTDKNVILQKRLLTFKNTKYNNDKRFVSGLTYLTNSNGTNSILLNNKLNEEQIAQLKLHLYNDLSKMDGIERNFNENAPKYYLAFANIDDYYDLYTNLKNPNETENKPNTMTIDDLSEDSILPENIGDFHFKQFIPIYENMTETINYLNNFNLYVSPLKAEDIKSVEYFSAKGRFDNEKISELYTTPNYKKVKDDAFFLEVRSKGLNDYTDKFGRLVYDNTTTEQAQIEKLFNNARATYQIVEDNGLIAKFITNNGERYTAYIPESCVPDFAK